MKFSNNAVLAIDIGGTKFEVAVVGYDGTIHASQKYKTPNMVTTERLYGAIKTGATDILKNISPNLKVKFGSIGCGGPMDLTKGEVSPVNISAFRDFPLVSKLQQDLNLDVYIDNDAKALTLAEKWLGAAGGLNNFISMVVSTGIGGGIFLENRILGGDKGNCGHIGHVNVVSNGHRCGCSARGCLEAEASGTAIQKIYGVSPKNASTNIKVRTGKLVGKAVGSVFNLLDIDRAFVAGSVALGYKDIFFQSAQKEIDRICRLDFTRGAIIQPSILSDRGPILGAAAVGLSHLHIIEF